MRCVRSLPLGFNRNSWTMDSVVDVVNIFRNYLRITVTESEVIKTGGKFYNKVNQIVEKTVI